MEHWAKKLFQKNHPKTCSKHVWTLLRMILGLFGFWIFLNTRLSMEHWAKTFFSKKLPQNMFKTRLHTFGNDFGHLWNFEIFLIFFEIFPRIDPPWNSGKKLFFPKKAPKDVWTLGNVLDNLGTLNFFWFFPWIFFYVSSSKFESGKLNSFF